MPPSPFAVEATADGSAFRTRGLRSLGQREIRLVKPQPRFEDAAIALLRTLGEYELSHEKPIRRGDKVRQGYWLVMLEDGTEGDFEVFELTADGANSVRGANLTLRYWTEQSEVCRGVGADFSPPYLDQKVATSVGLLEGDLPVSGVRYEAPPHMSGWYLTTERYSGDAKDLRVDHLYHVTSKRPDLACFLALPPGFRFELMSGGSRVFFDPQIVEEG